jgi:hypothetical protein
MDFYRLKTPGAEWLTRQGDAIKAARAEKVEWEKIEVPTSKKEEMQTWLNTHARGGIAVAVESEDEPLHEHRGKEEACLKCKWTPRMCEAYIKQKLLSLTVEAMKQWIEEREGWELTAIVEAITHRLLELSKLVGKKV